MATRFLAELKEKQSLLIDAVRSDSRYGPSAVVFVFTVFVTLLWRYFRQPEGADTAIWDYVAQCILRGQIPYKDVIEIKTPGSAYLSAAAMWLGRHAWLGDLLAVRFMQVAVIGALSVVTFAVAEKLFRNRFAALISFLPLLISNHFISYTTAGTQPKLWMILFGMTSILLIGKDRPFWAGLTSMLSCLCWQPGLLFTGTAVLISSGYLTRWRDLRALKAVLGGAIPLAAISTYFYAIGAIRELWMWTVLYDFSVYAPGGMRGLARWAQHASNIVHRSLGLNLWLWQAAGAGLLMTIALLIRARLAPKSDRVTMPGTFDREQRLAEAVVIPAILYIVFCFFSFNTGIYLLPLYPFAGIFAAAFFVQVGKLFGRWSFFQTAAGFLGVDP
ncbi:MAG TPA: DolP-mannose mannosyltransferase, partial [Blastocatellia bacterium]|nr:DolP-mannose mannosyltransferase [Blastocatellia bacterium]